MTTISRKKPGVAFWATVVLVVALAYPVSFGPACWKKKGRKKGPGRPGQDILECPLFSLAFGPACWITSRTNSGASAVAAFYQPIFRIPDLGTGTDDALDSYSRLLAAPGWAWGFEAGGKPGEYPWWEWEPDSIP